MASNLASRHATRYASSVKPRASIHPPSRAQRAPPAISERARGPSRRHSRMLVESSTSAEVPSRIPRARGANVGRVNHVTISWAGEHQFDAGRAGHAQVHFDSGGKTGPGPMDALKDRIADRFGWLAAWRSSSLLLRPHWLALALSLVAFAIIISVSIRDSLVSRRTRQHVAYNLARNEAKAGRSESAIALLQEAVAAGYRNFQHMQSDPDLERLRDIDDFKKLISS